MGVRAATIADFESIGLADPIVESDPSRAAMIREGIAGRRCWIAEELGDVAGYALVEYTFYGRGFLSLLVVRAESRRRGHGRDLLRQAVASCMTQDLFTSTNESNGAMQALLHEAGFLPSGVIHNLDEGDPELVFFKRVREIPA